MKKQKRPNKIIREKLDNYLKSQRPIGNYSMQIEIISGNCCEYCDSMNGNRIDLDEAIKKRYLASEKCTREWGCNCCYAYTAERDENGDLIIIEVEKPVTKNKKSKAIEKIKDV